MTYRAVLATADRAIGVLLFAANVAFMLWAEIYNPGFLIVLSAPALLHMWRNGHARLGFALLVLMEGWVIYVACDITNGPENAYLHPMHDLTFPIAFYGLVTSIWIYLEDHFRRPPSPREPEVLDAPTPYYRGR